LRNDAPHTSAAAEPARAAVSAHAAPHALSRLVDGENEVVQRQILAQSGFVRHLDLGANQAVYNAQNGFTPPMINTTRYASGDPDTWAAAALNRPTLAVRQDGETYKASVAAVPTNHVGYRQDLPAAPPWSTPTVAVDARRRGFLAIDPPDHVTHAKLEVTGNPNADALAGQVERHENYHARDIERRRDQIIKPWDTFLMNALKTGREFSGADAVTAQANLWAAAGGTPDQIAERLVTAWNDDSNTYHHSADGRTFTNPRYDANTNTIVIVVRLPT
jgi:hypothetical protein